MMGKDDMSWGKDKDGFPKNFFCVQNPTEFDYYQRGLHGLGWRQTWGASAPMHPVVALNRIQRCHQEYLSFKFLNSIQTLNPRHTNLTISHYS
jgi:hypothetical protein